MEYTTINPHNENGDWKPKPASHWKKGIQIFSVILVILGIYYGFKVGLHRDGMQFFQDILMIKYLPRLGNDSGLGLLFLLGILTSFHCLAMCGAIVISQMNESENTIEGSRALVWFYPSLFYNAGRVISYTLVGAIIGGLGQAISFIGIWKGLVPFIGGLWMIVMGMNLLGIFPLLRRLNLSMPYFAFKKICSHYYGSFLIGMLSGLMPCGPLQIVELYALGTGSALFGALSMFCFAMGTVPLLFTLGTLHSTLLKKYTHSILKISAILVIFLGLVMIGRGLALSGIVTFGFENTVAADTGISHVAGNIQTVVTSIKSERYPTIVVQQGIPVRWIIKADSKNLNGCNQAITIPKLKIVKKLRVGENLIEFTPHKIGDIIYTCWMGMIKSQITVVVDIAKVKFKRK